jgi:hypothetical protein
MKGPGGWKFLGKELQNTTACKWTEGLGNLWSLVQIPPLPRGFWLPFLPNPLVKCAGKTKNRELEMSFQRGLEKAVTGIIGSILINSILAGFAKDGLIPSYLVISFTVAGFLGSVVLMFSFKTTGVVFTLGWIFGAFMLKDLLGPIDFIVYLIAPIVALIVRAVSFFKGRGQWILNRWMFEEGVTTALGLLLVL